MPNKRTKKSDRKLTAEEQAEVRDLITAAYRFLKLRPRAPAKKVQESIFAAIVAVYRGKTKLPKATVEDLGIKLGCLWGQTVCDSFGWEWCIVHPDKKDAWIAVVSPDRSYAVSGMFITQDLRKRYPQDIDSLMLFNLIEGGKFRKGKPRSYLVIG